MDPPPPRRTASGAALPPPLNLPSGGSSSAVLGASDDDCPRSSRLRSTRGRSQPFFIGVAGERGLREGRGAHATVPRALPPASPFRAHLPLPSPGGTASGKTTVVEDICQRLHDQCVVMLAQDSFYRGLTPVEAANVHEYNFDAPDAFDTDAMVRCMRDLRAMKAVEVPTYDFARHSRSAVTRRVEPADVVVVEGILVLHIPEVRALLNMKARERAEGRDNGPEF